MDIMTTKLTPVQPLARAASDNTLLTSLSSDDFAQVCMELAHVRLHVRDVLYEPGEEIKYVYFPTSGCVSMVHVMQSGTVEVGTVGCEGMVGVPLLLHGTSASTRALVQIEGDAYRVPPAAFLRILALSASTSRVVLRFT